jgi:hypothetical protein
VAVDHGLLHRVELARRAEAFDGDDVGAVELEEELDAGVDGKVAEGGDRSVCGRAKLLLSHGAARLFMGFAGSSPLHMIRPSY